MSSNYTVKNLTVDLVEDRAHLCIACTTSTHPTMVSVDFPLNVSSSQGEEDLRSHARHKARMILERALASMMEEEA